jgi:hypothetical protein
MNSEPHRHEVRIRRYQGYVDVQYGDTEITVYRKLGFKKRNDRRYEQLIRRAVEKVITAHAMGTMKAARRQAKWDTERLKTEEFIKGIEEVKKRIEEPLGLYEEPPKTHTIFNINYS